MSRVAVAAAVAVMVALAGCGQEDPTVAQARSAEAVGVAVEAFEDALRDRDAARICNRLFSPEARRRAGGEECVRRLRRSTARLNGAELELLSVTLAPDAATARVRARSAGQPAAIDVIQLVPRGEEYSIESIGRG